MDNEFILYDRLEVIRKTIEQYGEDNFYLSFSGGKDSTVVHHLLDMALPDNKIPRVFFNTGIEYNAIVNFVQKMADNDERFVIIKPTKNIKTTLEDVGYPFKSKEHSAYVRAYQKGYRQPSLYRYINKEHFGCPAVLRYQFTEENTLKISDKCCYEFKKKVGNTYKKESGRKVRITGMMKSEAGERTKIQCILLKNDKLIAFHPLAVISPEWEKWFLQTHHIELCELYYPPYNFERTGCKGCPYSLHLQEQLEAMEKYMPNERKQCEYIWKPVYDEYRRLGYRLDKEEQIKLI